MLALSETEIVEMPQVCFPFATDAKGQTLYEKMLEGKFLLGSGSEETSTQKTRRVASPGLVRKVAIQHVSLSQGSPARKVEQNFPCEDADTRKVFRQGSESSREGAENSEAPI